MKPFDYQHSNRYFAQTAAGFESPAAEELHALGARQIKTGFRGLYFSADPAHLLAINYQSRLVTRILAPLASFPCRDRNDLYRAGKAIDWSAFFTTDQTFGIFANVSNNAAVTHSKFAALCLKDAVADFFRGRFSRRPDVDKRNPDVWLNLHIDKDRGTISLDTSGGSLHRRGYRREAVEAPMQETLAAAMVAISAWDGQRPLFDPMCGSGTLLCEALMKACRIPAAYLRPRFGFEYLPDFDPALWRRVRQAADEKIRPLPAGLISGSDRDPLAVRAARVNSSRLPGGRQIRLLTKDFRDLPDLHDHLILCNPPYGIRLQSDDDLGAFYKEIGDFLKQRCKGAQAVLYFGNRDMLKHIGLKAAWKKPLRNAGIDGRIAKFEMY